MANLLAAPIRESLARVNETIAVRRQIEAEYDAECPPAWRMPPRACPWVYDLRIPGMTAVRQDEVIRTLREEGIEARHCFKPMSTLPEFSACDRIGGRVCDGMAREVIYLPIEPGRTTTGEVRRAFEVIRRTVL
jgi:dTDP-4-amino-4,6-dideoxygalactose transaminase